MLTISMALLYGLLSVGVNFNVHLCHGDFCHISWAESSCDDGHHGEEESCHSQQSKCCDDVAISISIEDEHQQRYAEHFAFKTIEKALLHEYLSFSELEECLVGNFPTGPPDIKEARYILNCALVYYG